MTYIIALVVVIGGGAVIFLASADPNQTDTVAIMAGFVGSALTFVFGSEVQTRTARQSAAATLAANTNGNPGVINGGSTTTNGGTH